MSKMRRAYPSELMEYLQEIEKRRQKSFSHIASLPIANLILESISNNSPMCTIRRLLQDELLRSGHVVDCNEDITDTTLPFSSAAQSYANLEAYDLVFSIPDSAEDVTRTSELTRIPHISNKIITYFDQEWNNYRENFSLMARQAFNESNMVSYDASQLPACIIDHAFNCILRVQEIHYMKGRRR